MNNIVSNKVCLSSPKNTARQEYHVYADDL